MQKNKDRAGFNARSTFRSVSNGLSVNRKIQGFTNKEHKKGQSLQKNLTDEPGFIISYIIQELKYLYYYNQANRIQLL